MSDYSMESDKDIISETYESSIYKKEIEINDKINIVNEEINNEENEEIINPLLFHFQEKLIKTD
ncbi:756_t:CDS:1, partial [Funneliformis caledonium]